MSTAEVFQKALQLNPSERADLAHQLVLSLDADAQDPDYEEAWRDELNRRLDAVESGTAELAEPELVFDEVRRRPSP